MPVPKPPEQAVVAKAVCIKEKPVLKDLKKQKLSTVFAKGQSYIQLVEFPGKQKLLIACSENQHKEHGKLIRLIFDYMTEHNSLDKALASRIRKFLLS